MYDLNLYKFNFGQLVILVDVTQGEDLSHGLGHVHVASVHTKLNEEGHHVQQLLNTDIAIPIFIKQFKHLGK